MYLTKTWSQMQNFEGQAGNSKKPAYLAGFVAFPFAFFSRGCGGVFKNRMAMSSIAMGLGARSRFGFCAGIA